MSSPAVQLRSRVSSFGEAAVEKARLTVVPVNHGRAPRVPFIVLVSVLAIVGVVGLLLFNTSLQQASFTEAKLTEQAAAMVDREETLRMQLDDLRDPQRIAGEAEKMGMVIPAAPVFLRLDGTVVGEPRPATREDKLRIRPRPKAVPPELRPRVNVVKVKQTQADRRAERRAEREANSASSD